MARIGWMLLKDTLSKSLNGICSKSNLSLLYPTALATALSLIRLWSLVEASALGSLLTLSRLMSRLASGRLFLSWLRVVT